MWTGGWKKFKGNKKELKTVGLVLVIISSVLNALALMYVNYILGFLAFPFLFYFLLKAPGKKQIVFSGVLFGAVSSLLLNIWMIPVIMKYAQGSLLIAIGCWIASALVLAALFGFQFYLYSILKLANDRRYSLIHNALLMASLWVLFEWTRAECFSGIPWLSYSVGISQGSSLFLMQLAAYGGVFILSFIIIFSAYFISYSVFTKQWKLLGVPVLMVVGQFSAGVLLYQNIQEKINIKSGPRFSVAFVLSAQPPETVWNEKNADGLVRHLLSLNRQAVKKNPDLVVWSETVVPWTYAPDDDFLAEITKETAGKKVHSLVGMNSVFGSSVNALVNSAYLLDPVGKTSGRYDKQGLLTFVEKPLLQQEGDIILPFLAGSGMKMLSGAYDQVMETPWGKAGMLLCNESTYSSLAAKLVQTGASYLVNMGNDSWFSDYFITRQHFYNSRFRAVETRKDVIINNNMGICGLVQASGEIAARYDGKISGVKVAEVTPNQLKAGSPVYFIYLLLLAIIIQLIFKMYLMLKSKITK